MKLVDILARELKVWPEGDSFAWQDYPSNEVRFNYSISSDFFASCGADDCRRKRYEPHPKNPDGHVTRAQWQSAVDALAAKSSEAAKDMHDTAVNAQDRDGINIHSDESHPTMDHIVELELLQGMASGNQYRCNVKGIDPGYQEPFKTEWNGEGLPPIGTVCEAKMPPRGVQMAIKEWTWRKVEVVRLNNGVRASEREVLVFDLENTAPSWVDELRPIRTDEQIAAEERKLGIDEMSAHGIDAGDSTIEYTCAALWDAGYRKQ